MPWSRLANPTSEIMIYRLSHSISESMVRTLERDFECDCLLD